MVIIIINTNPLPNCICWRHIQYFIRKIKYTFVYYAQIARIQKNVHIYLVTLRSKTAKRFLTHSSSESSSSSGETTRWRASLHHRNAGWGRGEASCAEEAGTRSWSSTVAWQRKEGPTAGNICVETVKRERDRETRNDYCPAFLSNYSQLQQNYSVEHSVTSKGPAFVILLKLKYKSISIKITDLPKVNVPVNNSILYSLD